MKTPAETKELIIEIKESKILVVEGKDEELFFGKIISHLRIKRVQVLGIGGKEKIRPNLIVLCKMANFNSVDSLGIIRDADTNPSAALDSVRDALGNVNRTVPDVNITVPDHSLQIVGKSPRVSVYIMPKLDSPGMLEDLCLSSISKNPAMRCVDELFQCIKNQGIPLPRNKSKAKVHAFLSTRKIPGLHLGEAAQKGYWHFDNPAFNELSGFLKALFNP
jgi:hypothetical protein